MAVPASKNRDVEMSEFKQFLQFMKWLIPAILFVVGMMFVPEAVESIRGIFRRGPDTEQTVVKDIGLHEMGDLVALTSMNSVIEFWEQSDGWFYEGKEVTVACDYELEYRFDLTKAVVEDSRSQDKNIRIKLPEERVKCSINELRVLESGGGWSPIGTYRIRPDQMNRVFNKAKASAIESVKKNKVNATLARRSVEGTIAALFVGFGVPRAEIEFTYVPASDGADALSVSDDEARRKNEGRDKETTSEGK